MFVMVKCHLACTSYYSGSVYYFATKMPAATGLAETKQAQKINQKLTLTLTPNTNA